MNEFKQFDSQKMHDFRCWEIVSIRESETTYDHALAESKNVFHFEER